jgi:hypothetical protein
MTTTTQDHDDSDTHIHHHPDGWTIPTLEPGTQTCTTNHTPGADSRPPCTNTAVWKVVEHYDHDDSPGLTLSFWCDSHLPDEHRAA